MPLKVKFVGAVGAVTGSCHILQYERSNSFYMIDCGIYQNTRGSKDLNMARGEVDLGGVSPSDIKAIFLTHAHMDHCGLIPRMYRLGFKGQVYCTRITADFVKEALSDTVRNVDSFDSNLYDKQDVDSIKFYCPDERLDFQLGLSYSIIGEVDLFYNFSRTGHLAGAVAISFETNISDNERLSICFGGDLGPQILQNEERSMLLRPVQYPREIVDYLVLESTYGGQPTRTPIAYIDKIKNLSFALERALSPERGMNPRLVIPAFTLGRTQDILVDLAYLITRTDFFQKIGGRAPTVVIDSSLARSYSNSYRKEFNNWWYKKNNNERKMRLLNRKHALFKEGEVVDINLLLDQLFEGTGSRTVTTRSVVGSTFELHYGRTDIDNGPVIYISSSGMCSSGPVMGRLRDNLKRKDASVMFIGYLPPGFDASVLKRASASWKSQTEVASAFSQPPSFKENMFLVDFETNTKDIQAALLDYSGVYSGHADENGLCEYTLRIDNDRLKYKPISVFLVHGDDVSRGKLRRKLQNYADTEITGKRRQLKDIIIPTPKSGWYNLAQGKWDEVLNNQPTWQESLKLLAEASDLQESISSAWYRFKSFEGEPVKQTEYLRRIDVLLDNLEQWRMRFRKLTQRDIGHDDLENESPEESYDNHVVYLDVSSTTELRNYANVIGISGKITRTQLRLAWKDACTKFHPDLHPTASEKEKKNLTSKMQKINESYSKILTAFQLLV